ncbi:hypothetical protein BC939DRAFT_434236 [Gamsiella multidivaricata]|uniref:uncharacterized protein n=1 Tax=Gamsiella multidivaricata TaxID=101098 RepID=UPI00221F0753|nr:uncharacterized protein BC939DRAFT_434236 [Gamsiella multidivaricata]KAG0366939.1 SCF ubiquitin ligase complex subunit [Gamsiella multidivaricata]KAI7832741.1 hypothetical protein BC939DRAFT_434236 [Gamsiella multidivaricata]
MLISQGEMHQHMDVDIDSDQERERSFSPILNQKAHSQGTMEHFNQPPSTKPHPIIPSELILHIFKFLSAPQDLRTAILVCKLWCSCGMDLLWSRPALLSLPLVEKMCQTISLGRSETVFPYADYIRRLNFSFLAQDLTDDVLIQFSCCRRLERLLLPGCTRATEEGLKQILEVGHGLYSLDLSDISAVTDSVLEHVAEHCPKLHTLYLTGCVTLTDESVVKLATSCPSLKRIKLGQCMLLTDRSILALIQHCPHLMEIDVTNCNLMTNNAIQAVFRFLPQIRDINMALLTNLTDHAFASIPIGSISSSTSSPIRFEQLRVLNLTSCAHITDETLARIIPAAPRLRNLALTKCDQITDVGASVIKLLGKHLHYLHLGHCSKLTDRAITTLTQHCTRIRYLDLACCSKLTDAAVFAMAQLPKLRRIGLVKCSNITDHGIYAMLVSQIVPQTLERVHLSYCVHLSDTAVAALVNQCTKLTHLSVTGVPAFTSPKYQKFCRVPPSEFTAHQREVFCVFSGKGVRELRHFMHENPTMPLSTLSSIQRSYRIMGSTVASMVAGGQHSSAILAHLGLTLRETEAHVQSLSVAESEQGSSAMAGPGSTDSLSAMIADGTLSDHHQQQQQQNHLSEALTMELEQEIEDLDEAEQDYAEMMMQQHHLLRRHHHRHHYQRHPHHGHHGHGTDSASSGISSCASASETSTTATTSSGQDSSSSSASASAWTPNNTHLPLCPYYHNHARRFQPTITAGQDQDAEPTSETAVMMVQAQDDRMATPSSVDQEQEEEDEDEQQGRHRHHRHHRSDGNRDQARGEGEGAEGSSGGSGRGSPTEEEDDDEEEVEADKDVFGNVDADDDDVQRAQSSRR